MLKLIEISLLELKLKSQMKKKEKNCLMPYMREALLMH